MQQKTVLLTGATGLLGKQILQQLIAQDYKIYALKRANSIVPIVSEKINWTEISSNEENVFIQISENINYVIHAGAMVSYRRSDKDQIFQTNTDWTSNLASDALRAGVKKFIFISSISALGKDARNDIIDEKTPVSDHEFLTNYGKSKRLAEDILWGLSKEGLSIVIFNPSVIMGPAKRYQSSTQLFGYVSDQKPFYTKGIINYIDVRDVAEIIVKSLEDEIHNEQFVLNAGNISYHDFFGIIARELSVKAPNIGVPKFMVIIGAIMENLISKLKGKPATLTWETAKMAGNKKIYNAEKAKTFFNISHKTLEQSIEWTVREMQKSQEL